MVTVQLTSNSSCASQPTVSSNAITISVGATVNPAVTIAITPSVVICENDNVVFTAQPQNGGATPAFIWKLNGVNVGANSPVYSNNQLADGDIVTVQMNATGNCLSSNTAVSPSLTMQVNPSPALPTIAQSGSTLTSSAVTGNQWLLSNAPISGAINQTYNVVTSGW